MGFVVEQLVCICLYTGSTCLKQFASCGTNVEFIGIILFSRSWRVTVAFWHYHFQISYSEVSNDSIQRLCQQITHTCWSNQQRGLAENGLGPSKGAFVFVNFNS